MMRLRFLIHLFLLFLLVSLSGQNIIFPGLSGQELLDSLVANYKPPFVLSYATARDSMYAYIDNHNDSVSGVYTGYTIFVPHGSLHPRNYTNAADPIINAEHTWPRNKGATGMAKRDLHHLFPTNANANSARASFRFDEIPDNLTDRWYRDTDILFNIPPDHIDEYSELDINTRFEPREDHKGNVARAMFYFYTMYRAKADSADPNFFDVQKNILRYWNSLDPVDSAEIARTLAIANLQGGKVNPFVMDTSLIGRAYFGVTVDISPGRNPGIPQSTILFQNYPNPFNPSTNIGFRISDFGFVSLAVYNLLGEQITTLVNENLTPGNYEVQWNGTNDAGQPVASGLYFYQLRVGNSVVQTRKMILIR